MPRPDPSTPLAARSLPLKQFDEDIVLRRLNEAMERSASAGDDLEALLSVVRGLWRLEQLNAEISATALDAFIRILQDTWKTRDQRIALNVQSYKTAFENPLIFGRSLLEGFIDFYLSDLIATLNLLYDTAVFAAKVQGCLQLGTWVAVGAVVLDVDQAARLATSIASGDGPCKDLIPLVEELDRIRQQIEDFVLGDGLTNALEAAPDLIEDMLNALVVLLRVLPDFLNEPYLKYASSVVEDPVALGRINGAALALIVGLVLGVEELLVFATGVRMVKPVIIIGGILGSADEPVGEPQGLRSVMTASPVRRLLKAASQLSEAERRLVGELWRMFLWASEARAMEQAGRTAAEIEQFAKNYEKYVPALRRGTRRLRPEDLHAAGDLARNAKELVALAGRFRPALKRLLRQVHYLTGSYGELGRLRTQVNGQIERFFIFSEAALWHPAARVDLEIKSTELQQQLFEIAHIVDKAFAVPTTEQRRTWRMFQEFAERMPAWKSGSLVDEARMPGILLLGREHRIPPPDWLREFDVTFDPSAKTITGEMEYWLQFTDGLTPEQVAKYRSEGRFIIDQATAAIDVVRAQRAIYRQKFPTIFEKIAAQLEEIEHALPESGRPAWALP